MMTRGQRIQKLRTDNSLSQEAFAAMLGVSRQSVSKWEADKAYPEIDKLAAISEKFGVSCDWLITGQDILEEEKPEDKDKVTLTKGAYFTLLASVAVSSLIAIGLCVYMLYTMIG